MNTIVYSKAENTCPYCEKAKNLLKRRGEEFELKTLDVDFTREELLEMFPLAKTFPQIIYMGVYVGGYDGLVQHLENLNDFNGQ